MNGPFSYTVENDTLVLKVDLSEQTVAKAQPSKSGKTRVVASSNGFIKLTDRISFGLNVITK